MNNNPLVSIIVPCYNQGQFLAEALNSVLAQSYQYWECIIINDGSTDNTEEIAKDYCVKDQRFKYLNKLNGGVSAARNKGIDQSTGEYILPLDGDDKLGPLYVECALKIFEQYPDMTLVYSNARLFGIKDEDWVIRSYSYIELLKSNMVFCSSMFKKADFIKTGGYDENLTKGYEDWDLFIRLLNIDSKVYRLNEVHFYYRIKSNSRSTAIDTIIHVELNHYLYRKYQDIYKRHFENPIDMIRKIEMYEVMYKNSTDYKFGNYLLDPIRRVTKTLKSVFK